MAFETPLATAAATSLGFPPVEDLKRAREVYRYVQPENLASWRRSSEQGASAKGRRAPALKLTNALAPFVQLAVLRCNVQRAFIE